MIKFPDGWIVTPIVEPNTGKCYSKYQYKRVKAKRTVLTSKLAKRLAGYRLVEKDLDSCLIWLQLILKNLENDVNFNNIGEASKSGEDREVWDHVKGLYVASLSFYGKCFSEAEGRGVKLERKNIESKFVEIHDKLIVHRNNFCAHSGSKGIEKAVTVVAAVRKRVAPLLMVEIQQLDTVKRNGIEDFIILINYLKEFISEKREEIYNKIMKDEIQLDLLKFLP